MQVIIPMTGYGSRFVAVGYKNLKPFIEVGGKPIIEWIVKDMYPGETNIIFVCRKEHIDSIPGMKEKLLELCPTARIKEVDPWVKLGPVYDVLQASELIDDEEPAIINYCDFFMVWDYEKFKKDVAVRGCDGCVPCYTGFHPHLLPEINLYASCKTDEDGNLIEIREKFSFEEDKTKANHSPGNYYFKSGALLKKYCQRLVDEGTTLKGEYYASLPYNNMVKDGLKVWVPTDIDYFCQWGTPEDLREYEYWVDCVGSSADDNSDDASDMQILIPMAGAGQRFADAGYKTHKPAIPTHDRHTKELLPMVVCAVSDLPGVKSDGSNVIFVDRDFHRTEGVEDEIKKHFPKAQFINVTELTEGQACTCLLAKGLLDPDKSLLIAGCDNGMVIDNNRFEKLTKEADELVFTYRHNRAVLAKPEAYGWMQVDDNDVITGASIKKPISDNPMEDHAVVATFWFKKASQFIEAAEKMIAENDRINNEFYVDKVVTHMMDLGYKAKVFEIDRYIGWGTPKDYEEYEATWKYWAGYLNAIK